jgi:hypothetical protein
VIDKAITHEESALSALKKHHMSDAERDLRESHDALLTAAEELGRHDGGGVAGSALANAAGDDSLAKHRLSKRPPDVKSAEGKIKEALDEKHRALKELTNVPVQQPPAAVLEGCVRVTAQAPTGDTAVVDVVAPGEAGATGDVISALDKLMFSLDSSGSATVGPFTVDPGATNTFEVDLKALDGQSDSLTFTLPPNPPIETSCTPEP